MLGLGCSIPVGEPTKEVVRRGGKWWVRSEAFRGETMRIVPSSVARDESIVNGDDDWDGDMGIGAASSKQK
jgi:hypothetical protein